MSDKNFKDNENKKINVSKVSGGFIAKDEQTIIVDNHPDGGIRVSMPNLEIRMQDDEIRCMLHDSCCGRGSSERRSNGDGNGSPP